MLNKKQDITLPFLRYISSRKTITSLFHPVIETCKLDVNSLTCKMAAFKDRISTIHQSDWEEWKQMNLFCLIFRTWGTWSEVSLVIVNLWRIILYFTLQTSLTTAPNYINLIIWIVTFPFFLQANEYFPLEFVSQH